LENQSDCRAIEVLSASRGLCYISLFEGFGIPILEAFACDTPVITSNVSSMPEVAGDAAILVDPKDISNIATAMRSFENDNSLRESLVANGKQQLLKYDWNKSAQEIFKQLKEIATSA